MGLRRRVEPGQKKRFEYAEPGCQRRYTQQPAAKIQHDTTPKRLQAHNLVMQRIGGRAKERVGAAGPEENAGVRTKFVPAQ